VEYGSKQYYQTYATAKYWFSNSRLPYKIWPKKSQKYVQCWHGTPLKKLGFDIIDNNDHAKYTKKELATQYLEEAKRFTYLLSPSAYATNCFESAFNLKALGKEDCVLELGYPRNDYLYSYKKTDISRIKKQLKIPNNKKIILYAPTWRDNQHSSATGYTHKNELDLDLMQKELGKEWVILYRAHYFISNAFNFTKYVGFVYDVSKFDDINELYIISDVLITDYSSVLFDYAILQRPIILYMPDLEYYQNNVRGLYFNPKSIPGDCVTSIDQILNAIITNNIERYSNERLKSFNSKYNILNTKNTASRVIEAVIKQNT
jgi:CDP-glycerol glycerophosphotransferase